MMWLTDTHTHTDTAFYSLGYDCLGLGTIVRAWSFLYGWGKNSGLAEEYGDKKGRAGGVGGWGQQVWEPGGHGEHRGGDKVVINVLFGPTLKINSDADNREVSRDEFAKSHSIILKVFYLNVISMCPSRLGFFVEHIRNYSSIRKEFHCIYTMNKTGDS